MKKPAIMNHVSRSLSKAGLKIKKHSPEILIVSGIVGVVTSTVLACKATTKLSGILDKAKSDIDQIHAVTENPELLPEGTVYTKEDSKKDLTIVYAKTGLDLVKLYAPAVALGALSLTAIVSSHRIMHKRNVALSAAYAAVNKGFKDYRSNVVDRFGKDLDRELKYNIKAKEIEETIVDEKGKEKKVKKTVEVSELTTPSEFAFFFDEWCTGWDKNAENNKFFLLQQQAEANNRLQERGHLFLNELHDLLGKDRTAAGSQVGWIYDPENPHVNNYVDLGIFVQSGNELYDEPKRAFVNGHERSILIDPNVDGVIYDLLP